ncbi:MAG: pyridoxal kinase PdxY [Roseiarcus sp.]
MLGAILSLQSHVAYGHVGNSAAMFPLQRLGREVLAIHTVQFSSHAGYPGFRGRAFDAGLIDDLLAGLDAIGALANCEALLTGYIGKPEIGAAALRALGALRRARPDAVYACDPVIGDEGRGVYTAPGVAEFFRDSALPQADIVTPNAFELGWLTGVENAKRAISALRARGPKVALVTSMRLEDTPADALDVVVADDHGCWRVRTPKLPIAVNGAGDLMSALFLAHWLETRSAPAALASAASSVYAVVAATAALNKRELALIAAQDEIVKPSRMFAPEPL